MLQQGMTLQVAALHETTSQHGTTCVPHDSQPLPLPCTYADHAANKSLSQGLTGLCQNSSSRDVNGKSAQMHALAGLPKPYNPAS